MTSVSIEVEPVTDQRSRLTIAVDFEGHGIGKVLVPLVVRRQARAEMPGILAKLTGAHRSSDDGLIAPRSRGLGSRPEVD